MSIFRRISRWYSRRQNQRACREARKRVGAMSQPEKDALYECAMNGIYPQGRWACQCIGAGTFVWVGTNDKCGCCGRTET